MDTDTTIPLLSSFETVMIGIGIGRRTQMVGLMIGSYRGEKIFLRFEFTIAFFYDDGFQRLHFLHSILLSLATFFLHAADGILHQSIKALRAT